MVRLIPSVFLLLAVGSAARVPYEVGEAYDCFICEYIKNAIGKLPQRGRTTTQLWKQVKAICTLPGADTHDCVKRSRQMAAFLNEAAAENRDPESPLCELITGSQCGAHQADHLSKHSGLGCVACFLGMNLLDRQLLKYEETVEDMFKAICNSSILNDHDRDRCINLLEKHFPQAYAAFVMTVSTKFVCGILMDCPLAGTYEEKNVTSVVDEIECHGCEIAFKYIRKYISKSHPDQTIAGALHFFCSHLVNKEIIEDCDHMVNEYAPEITNAVLRYLEPRVICNKFYFCKAED